MYRISHTCVHNVRNILEIISDNSKVHMIILNRLLEVIIRKLSLEIIISYYSWWLIVPSKKVCFYYYMSFMHRDAEMEEFYLFMCLIYDGNKICRL